MLILQAIDLFITNAVWAIILFVIALMLLRLIIHFADVNPFSWSALTVRRLTDPLVSPVRGALMGFGADPKYAPLITILITILLGWLALLLTGGVLKTLMGITLSLERHAFGSALGYLLYGLLGLYSLLIFMRIIFSWVMVSYRNPLMRFLVRTTDPLLVPLRRMIPPVGMFDISPIVAFLIIWLFQQAIAGTLL